MRNTLQKMIFSWIPIYYTISPIKRARPCVCRDGLFVMRSDYCPLAGTSTLRSLRSRFSDSKCVSTAFAMLTFRCSFRYA